MAWVSRGSAHCNLKQWSEAVTSYGKALEVGGLATAQEADVREWC